MNPTPYLPATCDPEWDRAFARLICLASPRIHACMHALELRFKALGLNTVRQQQATPRGWSDFLSLAGARGLICIVDMTWTNGMLLGQGRQAALDVRLIDAYGDIAAGGLGKCVQGRSVNETTVLPVLSLPHMQSTATAIFVAVLGCFDTPPQAAIG